MLVTWSWWLVVSAWAAPSDPWTDPPGDDLPVAASTVWLSEDTFVADSYVTFDVVYVVGPEGLSEGDLLRVEDPLFHGIRWSKWGVPHEDPIRCGANEDHVAPGSLVTVSATGGATVALDRSTDIAEIHDYAYTELVVEAGELLEGDEIVVRYGDTDGGPDCEHRMPYRAFRDVPLRVFELVGDADEWAAVPPVSFDIVAMDEVATVLVSATSVVMLSDPVKLKVAGLDARGNPVTDWAPRIVVDAAYGGEEVQLEAGDGGWVDLVVTPDEPGVHRIGLDIDGEAHRSNPVEVVDATVQMHLYWGDIHTHHGHTAYDEDGFRSDANHEYARDVVALDISSESMKNPPHEIGGAALWEEFEATCEEYTDEDYVALLGFEWMGGPYGHHNVYVDGCSVDIPDQTDLGGLLGDAGVYAWLLDAQEREGLTGVVVPHASLHTGFDWDERDNDLRTAIEVYSEWDSSMEPRDDPGSVPSALRKGNRFGFVAGSDNHDGWMGNPLSYRDQLNTDVLSGLGAYWAEELTREAVIGALRERTTYGTTGARILVRYGLVGDGAELPMGSSFDGEAATLHWEVYGTEAIARVALVGVPVGEGTDFVEFVVTEPGAEDVAGAYPWTGQPEEWAVWLEVEQVDGERAWTSPIWFAPAPAGGGGCGCGGGKSAAALPLLLTLWISRRRRPRRGASSRSPRRSP